MYRVENKVSLFASLFVERILVTNLEEYKGNGVYSPVIWNREIGYKFLMLLLEQTKTIQVYGISNGRANNMSDKYGIK